MRSIIILISFLSIISCSKEQCGDDTSNCVSTAEAKSCQELTGKDYFSSLNLLVDDLVVCVDQRPECIIGRCDYENQKVIEDPTDNSKNLILERRAGESEMYWVGETEVKEIEIDSDNDGFPDSVDDLCPNTPRGEEVYRIGCSLEEWNKVMDEDGDGILNNNDSCPGTKQGQTVDLLGCSEEDLADNENPNDIDNDGVDNENDKCSATPEGSGDVNSENGCSKQQFDEADFDSDGIKNKDEGKTEDGNSCVELSGKVFSKGCPLENSHKQEICEKFSSNYIYLKGKLELQNTESLICAINPRFESLEEAKVEKDYETVSKGITYDVSKRMTKEDGSLYLVEGESIRLANEKMQTDLLEIEIELNLPSFEETPIFSFRYVGITGSMSKFEKREQSSTFKVKIDKSDLNRSVFEYRFENLGDYYCGDRGEGEVYPKYASSLVSETKISITCTKIEMNGKIGFYVDDFMNGDILEVKVSFEDPENLMSIPTLILNKKSPSIELSGQPGQIIEIRSVQVLSGSGKNYPVKVKVDLTNEVKLLDDLGEMTYFLSTKKSLILKNRFGFKFELLEKSEEEKEEDSKKKPAPGKDLR